MNRFPDYPEEPVDGYELFYFTVDIGYSAGPVKMVRAVYHVDTAWGDFCPDDPDRGVDIVDHWMVYEHPNKHARGRREGWNSFRETNAGMDAGKFRGMEVFSSQAEAYAVAVDRLERRVEYLTRQLNEATADLIGTQEVADCLVEGS